MICILEMECPNYVERRLLQINVFWVVHDHFKRGVAILSRIKSINLKCLCRFVYIGAMVSDSHGHNGANSFGSLSGQ